VFPFFTRLVPGAQQAPPSSPIIVKIIEPPHSELSSLAGILIGSLGLTGFLVLMALAVGALVGGVMFVLRSRRPLG
jgi:hypothetical protein